MVDNIPLGQWSGSDATNALRESIERFNTKTATQTAWLLRLTWAIAVLTLVMAVGVGVQIYLARSVQWVLWTSAHGAASNGVSYAGTQFPDSIYASRNDCYRGAHGRAGPTGPTVLHLEDQNTWIVLHADGADAGTWEKYECWPDTLDPRGPKGK